MARPSLPVPVGELTPEELRGHIEQWAINNGYAFEFRPAAREYGAIVVRDPAGGHTYTTVHKPHKGRRLRKDQIRFVVRHLNMNWKG
jgi:hypothetical protein